MGTRAFAREVELFRQHDGGLHMAEVLRLGMNRKTPYAMRHVERAMRPYLKPTQ